MVVWLQNVKLRSLICLGLNGGELDAWVCIMSLAVRNTADLRRFYSSASAVRNARFANQVCVCVCVCVCMCVCVCVLLTHAIDGCSCVGVAAAFSSLALCRKISLHLDALLRNTKFNLAVDMEWKLSSPGRKSVV